MMLSLLLMVSIGAFSQSTEPDVPRLIARVNGGETDQVRSEIPALVARFPNDPGVLYIQGLMTREGADAVRIYQSIVDNFPRSEWADAALYRIYQFYYALGFYRTAEMKMDQLKNDYPKSKYMSGLSGAETVSLPEEQAGGKTVAAAPGQDQPAGSAVAGGVQQPVQFTLQVGAYTGQANAEKQKLFFENLGYSVEVISKVKESRSLFLVLVGSYSSYEEAQAKRAQIKQVYNVDSIVISK